MQERVGRRRWNLSGVGAGGGGSACTGDGGDCGRVEGRNEDPVNEIGCTNLKQWKMGEEFFLKYILESQAGIAAGLIAEKQGQVQMWPVAGNTTRQSVQARNP